MNKFNSQVKIGTKVQLSGEYGYRTIKKVNDQRNLLEVDGLMGSFQRGHVITYTNRTNNVDMFPSVDDLYTCDQYDSVYKREDQANIFIGKLNGKSLKQFVKSL